MKSNIKSPTWNCMLPRLLLLLVVCIGGSLARHWCQWTAGQCSVTCGDEGVIRRSRVCSCKRNRSNVFGKIKDKFVELINRDCRRKSPQVEFIQCPDLTICDDGRPNTNQIIAGCIVTIVLLCVLFASAKTWVPALYKYYFVDRDRRRRRRQQQQQLRRESMLAHPGPQGSVNRPAGGGGVDSSSDNLSVSFESSNGQQSVEPPEPPPHLQPPPLPPTYHDAVYGEVSGEPPPSYTEAVKEQRLQQQQQQLEQTQQAETPNLNVESELNDPLQLQSIQQQPPGPSDQSPNVV